jgi:hypothetical protein
MQSAQADFASLLQRFQPPGGKDARQAAREVISSVSTEVIGIARSMEGE